MSAPEGFARIDKAAKEAGVSVIKLRQMLWDHGWLWVSDNKKAQKQKGVKGMKVYPSTKAYKCGWAIKKDRPRLKTDDPGDNDIFSKISYYWNVEKIKKFVYAIKCQEKS